MCLLTPRAVWLCLACVLPQVRLQPGLLELLSGLHKRGMRRAIVTRNADFAVDDFLRRVHVLVHNADGPHARHLQSVVGTAGVTDSGTGGEEAKSTGSGQCDGGGGGVVPASSPLFDPILTREFTPCKPHPAPVQAICRDWGIEPHGACRVHAFPVVTRHMLEFA